MRRELYEMLAALAEKDPSVILVVADLGTFGTFRSRFPARFINVGVAEPNSAGIAAGLASQGKRVFLYGVAGFTLYRAFEQIKFSIGYWNQRVCIIGTGFGWRYYQMGRGHHAADDVAVMRLVPNMRVFAPVDTDSLSGILSREPSGPCYIRIGEGLGDESFRCLPTSGSDAVVVALGEMARQCSAAVGALRNEGVDVGLVAIEELRVEHVREKLASAAQTCRIIVVEDHVAIGGLGSIVRDAGFPIAKHVHLPTDVDTVTHSRAALLQHYGFDTRTIQNDILSCLNSKPSM